MIFSNEHAKRNYKVYTKQITKLLLYIVLQIRWQHTFLTTKHYTLSFPVTYLNFPNSINVKFINFDYLSRIPSHSSPRIFLPILNSPICWNISIQFQCEFSPRRVSLRLLSNLPYLLKYMPDDKGIESKWRETSRGIFKIAAGSGLDSIVNRLAGVIIRIKLTPVPREIGGNDENRDIEFLSLIAIHLFSRNDFNNRLSQLWSTAILVSPHHVRAYQLGLSTRY